jgi:hypothetical protein
MQFHDVSDAHRQLLVGDVPGGAVYDIERDD